MLSFLIKNGSYFCDEHYFSKERITQETGMTDQETGFIHEYDEIEYVLHKPKNKTKGI